MRYQTLAEWLAWQETLHPKAIDLGLERVGEVLGRMGLGRPSHAVITAAGTNGKGSSVAMLDAILRAAGYRVGTYTSPHLLRYNERVRINGVEASDAALCAAFDRVDRARGDVSLSYFEFGTLAALDLLERAELDIAVLEVGMGGRLDAVNLIDADVALITPIDVDHAEWLGPDRERIAREKAGIFRPHRPAICSDPHPPQALLAEAERLGTPLFILGRDYEFGVDGQQWWWRGTLQRREGLPLPALRGVSQTRNAAGVLMALEQLTARVPVYQQDVRAGLLSVQLPGRFQVLPGSVPRILDVGHNPHAAAELARNLAAWPCSGKTRLVIAMLGDKDAAGVVTELTPQVDSWYVAGLNGARGSGHARLTAILQAAGIASVQAFDQVEDACRQAHAEAQAGDRVVVFGSFRTVAAALTVPV
ncbi:MAG: bifunctional tetrahydrofolate synthase/dihydrofolate synthase [Thiohalomonadaceae bacterium]